MSEKEKKGKRLPKIGTEFSVVFVNRSEENKNIIEKICFSVNGRRKYLHNIDGVMMMKDSNTDFFLSQDGKNVIYYPAKKIMRQVSHRIKLPK